MATDASELYESCAGVERGLYYAFVHPIVEEIEENRGVICFGSRVAAIRSMSVVVNKIIALEKKCSLFPITGRFKCTINFENEIMSLLKCRFNFETIMAIEYVYMLFRNRCDCTEREFEFFVERIKTMLSLLVRYRYIAPAFEN